MNRLLSILALLALLAAGPSAAAAPPRDEVVDLLIGGDPNERRLTLPEFGDTSPREILPPVVLPRTQDRAGLQSGGTAFVANYVFSGNTAISSAALAVVAAPYAGREVSHSDLETLRLELTAAYVSAGYLNSGALIPSQSLHDATIQVQIVEGKLGSSRVTTDGRLPTATIERKLQSLGQPLRIQELEELLQLVQKDPRVKRLDAKLLPGDQRGIAIVEIDITEDKNYFVSIETANDQPGAVGEWAGRLRAAHLNVSGIGDTLDISGGISEGLREVGGSYRLPLGTYGTTLMLFGRYNELSIVKEPFDVLDLKSESVSGGIELRQRVFQNLATQADLFVATEYRRAQTRLLGTKISLGTGPIDGESELALIRFGQELTHQGQGRVFAARSTLTWGVNALGATRHKDDGIPDGQFFSWLGQLQMAQRLDWRGARLIGRFDIQLSDDPLLGLERFQLGGRTSVRGYAEKALVTDNGLLASVELRVPVWSRASDGHAVDVAVFSDGGHGWNRRTRAPASSGLASAGLALRAQLFKRIHLEAAWAKDLVNQPEPLASKLQHHGFHFLASIEWP